MRFFTVFICVNDYFSQAHTKYCNIKVTKLQCFLFLIYIDNYELKLINCLYIYEKTGDKIMLNKKLNLSLVFIFFIQCSFNQQLGASAPKKDKGMLTRFSKASRKLKSSFWYYAQYFDRKKSKEITEAIYSILENNINALKYIDITTLQQESRNIFVDTKNLLDNLQTFLEKIRPNEISFNINPKNATLKYELKMLEHYAKIFNKYIKKLEKNPRQKIKKSIEFLYDASKKYSESITTIYLECSSDDKEDSLFFYQNQASTKPVPICFLKGGEKRKGYIEGFWLYDAAAKGEKFSMFDNFFIEDLISGKKISRYGIYPSKDISRKFKIIYEK